MNRYTHDVIVLGGGSGGLVATVGLAELGLKTLLVEKERLGGDCLYFGCVPSKTLIKTARVYSLATRSAAFGLPDMKPARPDARAVFGHVRDVIEQIEPHDSPDRFRGLGAEVQFGSPRFVSDHEIRIDASTDSQSGSVSAPRVILATGSEPTVPPIPGLADAGYITNKEIFSLTEFPRRLVTIGGGPIGVELSQSLARLGVEVTLLEALPRILIKEDADMTEVVTAALVRDGVTIRTGISITRVETRDGVKRVVLGDGPAIETDAILVATGRRAALEGLDLDQAGVATERGFVMANEHLETTRRHILAIGDCNGKHLFTHVAGTEASLAVRRIAFRLPVKMDYDRVPWSTYSDPELASIGYNETRAKEDGVTYTAVEERFDRNDRALAEGETDGKAKILLDRRGKLIGAQIVGQHAGELIVPAIFGYANHASMTSILSPIYPYPTLSEIYRRAAGSHLGPKLFNPRIRKLLRLMFRYRGKR